uniref:Uncharacterized protein n=1 Tax=Sciurus vulgaris TaxID=55149 RepID=A0A8D2D7Q7_SCIVU
SIFYQSNHQPIGYIINFHFPSRKLIAYCMSKGELSSFLKYILANAAFSVLFAHVLFILGIYFLIKSLYIFLLHI